MAWRGRQLTGFTKNGKTITMGYDADGLRSSKTVNGVKTEYQYVGDKLFYENCGNGDSFYYFYDSYGKLSAIYHHRNGTKVAYHVVTNAQGDVISLYDWAGYLVAYYEYDAWGNCTITQDTTSTGIATLNPFRYRGYYYDADIGLYYLQSRYYDAEIGRFINADGYITTGQGVMSYNMYAYCGNNPVMFSDPSGHVATVAVVLSVVIGLVFFKPIVKRIVKYILLGREQEPISSQEIAETVIGDNNAVMDAAFSVKSGGDGYKSSEERKITHAKNLANAAYAANNNESFCAESIDTGYFENDYEYSQYCLSLAYDTNLHTNGLSWDSLCSEGKEQDFIGAVPGIDKNYHNIVRRDGLDAVIEMIF